MGRKAALRRRDTKLTKRGQGQARGLRQRLAALKIGAVITSPLLRALQTTSGMLRGRFMPVVVRVEAREVVSCPTHLCEMPIDPQRVLRGTLKRRFGSFDWQEPSRVFERTGSAVFEKQIQQAETSMQWRRVVRRRAQKLTSFLESHDKPVLLLVSHGHFLMHLTRDEYMDNCEIRRYRVNKGVWKRLPF